VVPPSGPNQVWQLDFTEYETTRGGVWRISGCADDWAKAELGWHVSMTQNHRDAISAVELAIDEAETLLGHSLVEVLTDPLTGEIRPIALVSDNGPAFKADGFARFIDSRPEFIHIRTQRKSLQQNGVRERAVPPSLHRGSDTNEKRARTPATFLKRDTPAAVVGPCVATALPLPWANTTAPVAPDGRLRSPVSATSPSPTGTRQLSITGSCCHAPRVTPSVASAAAGPSAWIACSRLP